MINAANTLYNRLNDFVRSHFFPAEDWVFGAIFRGSVITLVARMSNALLLITINLILARRFGAEMVGLVAAINSTLIVASIFSLAGTQVAVLRLIPEQVALHSEAAGKLLYRRLQQLVAGLALLVSVLLLIVCPLLANRFPALPGAAWFWGIPGVLIFYSLARLNSETLRALKQVRLYSLSHILPASTFLLFLVAVVAFKPRPISPVLAFFASLLATFLISTGLVRRTLRQSETGMLKPVALPFRAILAISWPMGLTAGLQLVLAQADQFMLAAFRSGREAGIYSIASKLAQLSSFIILSVNAVSAAHFSQLHCTGRKQELVAAARKSSQIIFWASLPIFLALLVAGHLILGWFGHEFKAGYSTLVLLVCGQFINVAAGSVALFLNMTGGQKPFQKIMLLTTVASLSLNLFLIPRYGMIGAAAVDLLCLAFWNGAAAVLIYRRQGVCISYIPFWLRKWRKK